MYTIPTTIEINGQDFKIRNRGDYRVVLDCFEALQDVELSENERIVASLIIFYDDIQDIEDLSILPDLEVATKEMFKFFNCGQEESSGHQSNYKLIDWNKDSLLICSGVNNVAKTEIRALDYLHWWTFMSYYMAIGESPLSTVVGIRSKIAKGKKLEKYEQQFRRDNPQYFNTDYKTIKQKEDDELLKQLWNKQ